jgi:hypothetical protein
VTEFERIYRRGLADVRRWYLAALAAQVRDEPEDAAEAWERYGEVLGQVMTLTALAGAAQAHAAAKEQGADWEAEEWPEERPETFAAASAGFGPGAYWKAIQAFRNRIPRSWWEVRRIRAKMRRLAERIAKAESREAIRDLSKRLQAFSIRLWLYSKQPEQRSHRRPCVAIFPNGSTTRLGHHYHGQTRPSSPCQLSILCRSPLLGHCRRCRIGNRESPQPRTAQNASQAT